MMMDELLNMGFPRDLAAQALAFTGGKSISKLPNGFSIQADHAIPIIQTLISLQLHLPTNPNSTASFNPNLINPPTSLQSALPQLQFPSSRTWITAAIARNRTLSDLKCLISR
ncbi:unnamed protein product [Rhodiola kirilowii]